MFFRGQIERPSSSLFSTIWRNSDLPVRVAINRERVHVIDDIKNVCALSFPNHYCIAECLCSYNMFDNVYVKETLEERQNAILSGMMQLKQLQSRREKI